MGINLLKKDLIFANNTKIPLTGVITETLMYSVLIPRNTFYPNNSFLVGNLLSSDTILASKTVKWYKNTVNSLVGATEIQSFILAATTKNTQQSRIIFFDSIGNLKVNEITITDPIIIVPFNTTINNYLLFTLKLSSGLDTANFESIYIKKQ